MLDVWSIEHVLSGLSIGRTVKKANHNLLCKLLKDLDHKYQSLHLDIIGVLFLAYLWETIEIYLEMGLLGSHVEYWFFGVEFWANRIIFDPLALVLGYIIVKRYPQLLIPARILSAIWLFVHIFIFPHSMYLHTLGWF
jgi:hypothetical protein